MLDKAEQRRIARATLQAFPLALRNQASLLITERLLNYSYFQKAKTVLFFASLPSEPSLQNLFESLNGRTGLFPKVTPQGLTWHRIQNWSELLPQASKVPEPPANAPAIPFSNADLILVPGVAFDAKGNRLGRGGGYYDRVLAELPSPIPRVGLFFDCQELPQIGTELHDQPLTLILTESRSLPCVRKKND